MKKNTFNDKLLIRILIFGLLAVAAIVLIAHYIDKEHNNLISANAAEKYIKDNNLDQSDKTAVLNTSKEAQFKQEEDGVAYRTRMLNQTGDLLSQSNRIMTIHFDLLKNKDEEFVKDAISNLEDVKVEITNAMYDLGEVNPPSDSKDSHYSYIVSMNSAIDELDLYIADVKKGNISGASSNTHIDKIKSIFSKVQASK